MNPLGWVLASLKTWPEPVNLPDVSDLSPVELAEIRSRLSTFSQVANELRKLVDQELAGKIPKALRYGDDVYRPNTAGTAKIEEAGTFWPLVVEGLKSSPRPDELLAALFPTSSIRITALPKLEAALSFDEGTLKSEYVTYGPPATPLSVKPLAKSPKFLQDLTEGELR